jgi:hypothetical protein
MKTSVSPQRSTTGRARAQGRNQKSASQKPAKKKYLVDPGMPKFSAALDRLERATGMPFEVWIKQPRPQQVDHLGRRLVPVLSAATLTRIAGGAR